MIWTTTPWTIPANRAISIRLRSPTGSIASRAPRKQLGKSGRDLCSRRKTRRDVFKAARVEAYERIRDVPASELDGLTCAHAGRIVPAYSIPVPLLDGDHVTDDTGTGFVHTAPSHGRDDFDIWMANGRALEARSIETRIPYTVDADGFLTKEAPGFKASASSTTRAKGRRQRGGDQSVDRGRSSGGRSRLKHQYPHSWRSKKPLIFRNTPQWFIALDKRFHVSLPLRSGQSPRLEGRGGRRDAPSSLETAASQPPQDEGHLSNGGPTLRDIALEEITKTKWYPAAGENRITGMIANRPDWVVSRQRAWVCRSPSSSIVTAKRFWSTRRSINA